MHAWTREEHPLTELFQHLVALVEDKVFDVLETKVLVADEGEGATGCAHHDVRAILAEHLLVLLDGQAAEEHGTLDAGHVLGEALILFANLEGQLACVAHDED